MPARTPLLPIALALTLCGWLGAAAPAAAQGASMPADGLAASSPPPSLAGSAVAALAQTAVRVDGVLDDAVWAHAETIELPYEYLPGDNAVPPARTECRVAYDAQNLYFGCTAFDPHPEQIRANYADRDQAFQDDHLLFLLDPFNDQRRAIQFRVTPLGVQMDALFAQGFEDFSWDTIWASAGQITDEGYVVEVAIPFKSLRFPRSAAPQTWGLTIERSYPRSSRHRISSVPRDRSNTCLLCQSGRLSGLQGIAPGRDVEINPTLTASRADLRPDFPSGGLVAGEAEVSPGLNLRWGVSPNISLNATLNPDFSQVEADAGHLLANQRFSVFLPEKRPFFLEGADLFQTFFPMVNTRRVVDPIAGAKVTAKEGRHALASFVTQDRVSSVLLPGRQRSRDLLLEEPLTTGVFRYQRDVGRASSVGGLYTGRAGGAYQNHVASADAFLRLSASNTLRAQVAHSRTAYPEAIASTFLQPEGTFGGTVGVAQFFHNSRNWGGTLQLQHLDETFRGDAGHLPRMGLRVVRGNVQRVVWGGRDRWFNRLAFTTAAERLTGLDGVMLDQGASFITTYQGPRQSVVTWEAGYNQRLWNSQTFDLADTQAAAEIRPSGQLTLRASGRFGEEVDFTNSRKGHVQRAAGGADLRLGRHLNLDVSHTLQRLSTLQGEEVFQERLTAFRAVYNLNVRAFVRGIVQVYGVHRDPSLYVVPVPPVSRSVSSQLLFAYKVDPQTVVFVGYADAHRGELDVDLTQESRSFFLKLSYALRT
jgi:hypothetical protein